MGTTEGQDLATYDVVVVVVVVGGGAAGLSGALTLGRARRWSSTRASRANRPRPGSTGS